MNKLSLSRETIIVAILLAALIVNVVTTCPLACICKWKGGKRKVECANKNLTALLTEIESETQVLDYSKNSLRFLTDKMFEKANLTNLQKLYISECQISQIHETAFRGLSNLIELDLSGNMLTTLPSQTFYDFPLLMKMVAARNPIQVIKSDTFVPLKYLASLDVSDCQIKTIDKDAFNGLQKLEWLKLDRNRLENIRHPETIPRVTGGISLHRNPWRCDCYLRNFHSWLLNTNKPIMVNPVCEEPTVYRGTPIDQLKTDDLACAPDVTPSSYYTEMNEGKNVSFICRVNATPEAVISWEFEGYPISNNSHMVHAFTIFYVEEAATEQVSELFISEVQKDNNGMYRCTAQNVAGKLSSNFTLNVITVEKSTPEPVTISYFYVLVSSISTLLIVIVITLIISCLIYVKNRRRKRKTSRTKPDIEYKIVKQSTSEMTPAKTTDKNPDLIINAETNLKETTSGESCEHMLLLPSDIKQTYLTLSGNTLLNTTIYESKALCPAADDSAILPATNYQTMPNGSTIKLYFSPNSAATATKFHNLYVNPFEGCYVDSIEQNYWTLQLNRAGQSQKLQENGQIVINCCEQQQSSSEKVYDTCAPTSATPRTALDDCTAINLRHNLEGYPYPSKMKLTSLNLNQRVEDVQIDNAPIILSPPDPFKTDNNSDTTENTVVTSN
ncbi:leucine-rich repeat neuronal protein 1-like [Planococcus citri]|uniref:leucine-rich repeat neuronal protein 1-like n=1 Tax=Planococcus citri TaxID=170843 RepID=UPI0031F7F33F